MVYMVPIKILKLLNTYMYVMTTFGEYFCISTISNIFDAYIIKRERTRE